MHDTYLLRVAFTTMKTPYGIRPARLLAHMLVTLLLIVPAAGRAASDDYPGSGMLRLSDDEARIDAVLLDTSFTLDVQGLLGELTLEQTFRNTTDRWLNGQYLFPLPADATVRGLELRIADRVVIGQVMKRTDADATFEQAREAGRSAGLIEQQRPNLFTARVANVAPGAEIRIRLDILLPVTVRDRQLSLILPTTLTPRHATAGSPVPAFVDQPILPASLVRGPRMTLDARIEPLTDLSLVESATHRLSVANGRISLASVPMDRDLELRWPFPEALADGGVADAAFSVTHGDDRYVQLFMAPPGDIGRTERPRRELVLVIDKSGSMAGQSIDAAREAAQSALDGLRSDDRFDLVAFDDHTRALFDSPRLATEANLAAGRRFIRRLSADGGTEMGPALARALSPGKRIDPDDDGSVRQIVFLTDGSITDEDGLLRQIRRDLGRARLFTVGIGNAPNAWFLDKAAEVGGGTSLAVRDIDDVQLAVTDLLGRLAEPVLTDIAVQFPGGADSYPRRIPDLYADAPLMVVARLRPTAPSDEPLQALVTGWQGETRFRRSMTLPGITLPGVGESHATDASASGSPVAPALALHWADARIASLFDEQRESRDEERHRDAITALALEVGLVTPYTSFVAVEAEPVRPDGWTSIDADVANLLPAGNAMLAIRLPRGAAGIDTLGLLSVLSGLLGGICLWARRFVVRGAAGSRASRRRRSSKQLLIGTSAA